MSFREAREIKFVPEEGADALLDALAGRVAASG